MKLITTPNQVLLEKAEDWDFLTDPNPAELEQEMVQVMKSFNGIGLAANQVGLLKRVFVIKLKDSAEPFAMFNPKLITQSEKELTAEEGCLSFPNLWLDIKRPQFIEVEYLDKDGKECKMSLSGIDARCFLHELDHLDGNVFTKKVSPMRLLLAQKKQHKQRKYNG